jgi:hypothetical protein
MSTLGRRLDALEQMAERVRRREMRELIVSLPDAHDLTPAELEAATVKVLRLLDEAAELRRQGLADAQIEEATAQRIGCPVETLRARHDDLIERFGP